MIDSQGPRGSLRRAVRKRNKPILVFEGGEPRRFDADVVEVGLEGTLRLMDSLGMRDHDDNALSYEPRESSRRTWIRAKRAGILRLQKQSGDFVTKGECLATIGDAFDAVSGEVIAPFDGLIISHVNNPLVHQGDAVIHLAALE